MRRLRLCGVTVLAMSAGCGTSADATDASSAGTGSGDAETDACACGQADGEAQAADDAGSFHPSDASRSDAESTDAGAGIEAGPPQPVGGQLYGLMPGASIVLQNNAGDDLTLSTNGRFTFGKSVAGGGAYGVTILDPPSSPLAQTCIVWDGSGTVGTLPVTDVRVNCDLLAYFPFRGGAQDESGYGHDGVVSGATLTTDRSGNANSAYAFADGGTIQAAMPVGFLPLNDEPRTLAAWLMPTQSNDALDVIFWGQGNCTALQFGIGDQGDNAAFWGGCDDYQSALPLAVGKWSFVAIVYSPATPTSIEVYVDGSSATGTVTPLMTGGSASLSVGSAAGSSSFFTGNIDSVRVFGRALQSAEVASLRAAMDP